MLEGLLYLALAAAVLSALAGCRAAIVLSVSVAVCLAMGWAGVEFHRGYWIVLDVAIMAIIGGLGDHTRREWAIVFLFPVAWAFYLLPDQARYLGSLAVTIAQLLLTYRHGPVLALVERARRTPLPKVDDLDLWKARA